MTEALPFRFRLLDYMSEVESASANTVMKGLSKEYGDKKYFKKPEVVEHLMSMYANGLLDEIDVVFDSNNDLEIFYSINDAGKDLLKKYLPKWWKK